MLSTASFLGPTAVALWVAIVSIIVNEIIFRATLFVARKERSKVRISNNNHNNHNHNHNHNHNNNNNNNNNNNKMQSCGGDNSISFNTVGFRSQCLASSK
jgi:ABC-type nickel/cobalt efflux system permease component RcnA